MHVWRALKEAANYLLSRLEISTGEMLHRASVWLKNDGLRRTPALPADLFHREDRR